jgi:hypothetical protein
MSEQQDCPKCGEECSRDEVDVGVGVLHGPWGCPGCGWSSNSQYDHSDGGACPAQADRPGYYVDQWGGAVRKDDLKERLGRFGIDSDTVDEVFP